MNLLRGEFYKLFKGKAFYICCLVAVLSVVFIYGTLFFADAVERDLADGNAAVVSTAEENMQSENRPVLEEITIIDVLQQMFGNFGSFITVIFAAIFVVGEYGNGAVKNVVGKGYKRWQIFGAKYLATTAAGLILLALMAVLTVASGCFFQKMAGVAWEWNGTVVRELFVYSGIQLLLGAAVTGMSAAIGEMCRHLGAGIAISFGIVAFSTLITSGLDVLIRFILPASKFRIADYWIMDLIMDCPLRDIDGLFLAHAAVIGIFWIVLTFGAGVWHFKKADIK